MDRPSESSRRHSVSLPGIRTLFPDHLLSTGGRTHHPHSSPPRSFTEQSVPSLPGSDHSNATNLGRPNPGPYERRLPAPPSSDGFRPINPPPSLGYPPESINASTSPRPSTNHPNRPSISSFQPPQEAARIHTGAGCATLLPRPSSPSSTISENESPRSETSSHGDLSADDSLAPIAADKQSDSGRRHACPHCAKRFNRPSSLAIHVNTHTGDKPFKCPFQNCGREFNVNSNMRRHYRKHLSSTASQTPRPGSFYSSQGTPGLGIQIIRYHDHQQPEVHSSDVGSSSPADSSGTRNSRTMGTRWRAL